MKKIAILIGMVLVLALAVAIWAQREPDGQQPYSAFYGYISYGCQCGDWHDKILITQEASGQQYQYNVTRCSPIPGYTTRGQTPEELVQGWYDLNVMCETYYGCRECPKVRVWHSGDVDQQVDLETH